MSAVSRAPVNGPIALADRATAPDLCRGVMLALIAVANVHLYLFASPGGVRGYPPSSDLADRVVASIQVVLADGPGLPLFAAVAGYGLVRMGTRHSGAVGVRRGAVMVGLGALHGLLLFPDDILAPYGLVTVVLIGVVALPADRLPTSQLFLVATAVAVPVAAIAAGQGLPSDGLTMPGAGAPTFPAAVAQNAAEWPVMAVFSALIAIPGALLGVWVARTGVLDAPAEHRRTLRTWAVAGLGATVVLGLPLGLVTGSWWAPPVGLAFAAGALHIAAGYAAVLGYLGLFGLLATVRLPGARLLAAAGTWSMSLYLSQSLVFSALLAAWAGGLGGRLGTWQASLIGLAVWALGVLVGGRLALAGRRGPAELLVRRVAYGGRS